MTVSVRVVSLEGLPWPNATVTCPSPCKNSQCKLYSFVFQAHRVVLASCSDYFRAMFTDAMRESRQSKICLNGVSAAGIRLLLEYAYTSRLALNLANIQDVLSAASHIQVVAVVEACSNYLQVAFHLSTCFITHRCVFD